MMTFHYDRHNKYHRMVRQTLIVIVALIIFIEAWWVLSIIAHSETIPNPAETWDALTDLIKNGDTITGIALSTYVKTSMTTFLKGFLLALVVAVPLGLILGRFEIVNAFATPIVEVLRPIAPIAWAPIFMISLGYQVGPMCVVFVGIFFPLLTNVIFGVSKIDRNLVDAAKTLGASDLQIFMKVLVPSTIPYMMNGIKIGLGIGWMCIVAAELYATPLGGIGFYLSEQATVGYWPGAFAAIIVIAFLGLITTGLAEYIHKFVSRRMGVEV